MSALERTVRLLRASQQPHAVFGAVALAAYGVQRGTGDIDLLASDGALQDELWRPVRGVHVDVRLGDAEDNLLGCVKVGFRSARLPVDVVVPKGRWPARALGRVSGTVSVAGLDLPVVTMADLVLAKVHSGGRRDVDDIFALCEAVPHRAAEFVAHVDAEQVYLYGPARRDWPRIRALLTRFL